MSTRPNVLLITSHDTGRHLGCYGVETVQTPHLDALAAEGVRFTNYFTAVPVCSPSRGVMLTGRYPQSNGLMGLTHAPWDWSLNQGERHLSHILRDAGYHTALCGLQHEASDTETLGFIETHAQRGADGRRADALTVANATAEFLHERGQSQQPFYAQIGLFETHRPFDFGGVEPDDSLGVHVPPYLEPTAATVADLAHLQGAVRRVDEAVGLILEALNESGLADNTIVVFTVDHGIEFPRAKWFCYEAGIGIAFIVRWPGGEITGGRTCDLLLSNVDFLPTLLALIDVPTPDNVEGRSFAAAFRNAEAAPTRDAIFGLFQSKEIRYVRTDRYKLIRNFQARRLLPVPIDAGNPPHLSTKFVKCPVVQLFDLERDPLELNNLADDAAHAEIFAELDGKLWQWLEQMDDPILSGPTPTPYYHEAIAAYRQS